jgi:cobalamin biosynthesis protein CobD/CbiB
MLRKCLRNKNSLSLLYKLSLTYDVMLGYYGRNYTSFSLFSAILLALLLRSLIVPLSLSAQAAPVI